MSISPIWQSASDWVLLLYLERIDVSATSGGLVEHDYLAGERVGRSSV